MRPRSVSPSLTRRRGILSVIAVSITLTLAGCATPPAGSAPSSSPSASAAPDAEQTPTPEASATPEPSASAEAPEAATPEQLIDACLDGATEGNQPAAEQVDRSTVLRSDARSALRPDGLWYVVIPIEDASVDVPVEYACLLTDALAVDSTWGRVSPEVDDFDLWATATEPTEGP